MRLRILLFLALLSLFTLPMVPRPVYSASASAVLSVTPSHIGPVPPKGTFSANVSLSLPAGEDVSAYDIRLQVACSPTCILNVTSIIAGNIFPNPQNYSLISNCVNGVGQGCAGIDGFGVAHSAVAYGIGTPGPGTFTMFTVHFQVMRMGSAVLQLENDSLISGSNTEVPHASEGAVFSNTPSLTPFFNVATAIPVVGRPVLFDASASFNSTASGSGITPSLNYSWSFGDGKTENDTSPLASHTYAVIRSYDVILSVSESGGPPYRYSRMVSIGSALGSISIGLTDQNGDNLPWNITVAVYNGSQLVETITKTPSKSPVTIGGLLEGSYSVAFSGVRITQFSKTEPVTAGWITSDQIALTVDYPPTQSAFDYLGAELLLLIGFAAAGIAFGLFAAFRKGALKRRHRKN